MSFPTYSSYDECINITNSCNGHGACISDGDGIYVCDCVVYWDPSSICAQNFYTIWEEKDLFYPILSMVICVIQLSGYLAEMIIDCRTKKGFNSNILAKSFSVAFLVSRLMNVSFWLYATLTKQLVDYLLDSIVFTLAGLFALCSYCVVLLAWIDVVSKSKSLSTRDTLIFKRSRRGIIIILAIAIPTLILLGSLSDSGISPFYSNLAFNVIAGVVILVMDIWSTVYVVKLKSVMKPLAGRSGVNPVRAVRGQVSSRDSVREDNPEEDKGKTKPTTENNDEKPPTSVDTKTSPENGTNSSSSSSNPTTTTISLSPPSSPKNENEGKNKRRLSYAARKQSMRTGAIIENSTHAVVLDKRQKVLQKNKVLLAVNIILFIYIINLLLHSIISARKYPSRYLGTMSGLRLEEFILNFLFFFIVENYMTTQIKGPKEDERCCHLFRGYVYFWKNPDKAHSKKYASKSALTV
eukprot:TRINITY_DN8690_c0_g1_i1.p1 TRINITY_DN8690_c0_g1~~TRINITY_DN8690_c0_g1_i1.p1  ORF type:complete len:466 (+),score=58.89 TRINITY_DN8690_c0_g1_i1:94-1491(+)